MHALFMDPFGPVTQTCEYNMYICKGGVVQRSRPESDQCGMGWVIASRLIGEAHVYTQY